MGLTPALIDTAQFDLPIHVEIYEPSTIGIRLDCAVANATSAGWTTLTEAGLGDSTVLAILQAAGGMAIRRIAADDLGETMSRTLANGVQLVMPRASTSYFSILLPDTAVAAGLAVLANAGELVPEAYPQWLESSGNAPTDNLFPSQWYLENTGQFGNAGGGDINALTFWEAPPCPGCFRTRIGVIDTGIDGTHPELTGRVFAGARFDAQSGSTLVDSHGHGTKVAGIMAAQWNNGGIAGIYPEAELTSIVWDGDSNGSPAQVASAVTWATAHCKIANCSVSGASSSALDAAVRDAYVNSVTLVASVGNGNQNGAGYPAANQGALGIGAVYTDGLRWDDHFVDWGGGVPPSQAGGSNWGNGLSLVAPGGRFFTTTAPVAQGSFQTVNRAASQYGFDGTSAAAPVVTGTVARLMEQWQAISPDDVRQVLIRTSRDIQGRDAVNSNPSAPAPENKYDTATGYGLIDPAAAYQFIAAGNIRSIAVAGSGMTVASETQTTLYSAALSTACGAMYAGVNQVMRYRMRATAPLMPAPWVEPYTSPPTVWPVPSSSNGSAAVTAVNPRYYPWLSVTQVTADSVTMETYLYKNLQGGGWWPVCPQNLVMSCTAYAPSAYFVGVEPTAGARGPAVKWRRHGAGIRFELSGVTGISNVEIFDIAGRRLARHTFIPTAGASTAWDWDGSTSPGNKLSPGVVFARLKDSTRSATVKLAILN